MINTSVLIPASALEVAKSRVKLPPPLRRNLAQALLAHTVTEALAAHHVGLVLVITADPAMARVAQGLGASVEIERPPYGLNKAVLTGRRRLADVQPHHHIAVMVSDLPLLDRLELDEVVGDFYTNSAPLSVADRTGRGTTFLMHPCGSMPPTRFGPNSARAHFHLGYQPTQRELRGLRHDLDTLDDLRIAALTTSAPRVSRFVDSLRPLLGATGGRPQVTSSPLHGDRP